MNKPELEAVYEIWPNDGEPWFVEVGQDRDGLRLVEIRYKEKDKTVTRMSFSHDFALLVGEAVLKCAKDLKEKETNKDV
jgi:hypothetical protein